MYNVWYRIITPNKYCTERERKRGIEIGMEKREKVSKERFKIPY